jgi:hypothetical protein
MTRGLGTETERRVAWTLAAVADADRASSVSALRRKANLMLLAAYRPTR